MSSSSSIDSSSSPQPVGKEDTSRVRKPAPLLLEQFRDYLTLLARMQIGRRYQSKMDASDVVQQTFLEAQRHQEAFRGQSPKEMAAWLRSILGTNLAMAFRSLGQAKRDIQREQSLQSELEASSARLEGWLVADQSSPSQRAQSYERILQLAEALAQLPDAQREALVLKHCHGKNLSEICQQLDKTPRAVAGLIHRGTKQLREIMTQKAGEERHEC